MTADVESHGVAMYRISFDKIQDPSNNDQDQSNNDQDPSNNDQEYMMPWYYVIFEALLSML